jgi:hypothetical protein
MTGLEFIKGAMRLVHALASGEEPEAAEANDALQIANDMLDGWAARRLVVYHFQTETLAWPAAAASRTIGAGGQLNTSRPLRIEAANWVDAAGISVPLAPMTTAEYQAILLKSLPGIPERIFLDSTFPLASLYLFPVPAAAGTLNLTTWKKFSAMTLAGQYLLPEGYNELIRYQLALRLGEFGKPPSDDVRVIAEEAMDRIMTLNIQVPNIESDLDDWGSPGFNILAGS